MIIGWRQPQGETGGGSQQALTALQPWFDSGLSSLTACNTSAADGDSVLKPVSFWVAGEILAPLAVRCSSSACCFAQDLTLQAAFATHAKLKIEVGT